MLFHEDKAQRRKQGQDRREGAQKKMSACQVVHDMLCCTAGIRAPTDLFLLALILKQADNSWPDTVLAESLHEIHT